ncbi:PLP-dependent aminotransferase family protein [Opitutus terrae]|uniref:Transcriptional regulator, GntR family with aminotransferase domain n=1 Tax=Opitutus terrae (strain DSM 11246 / JCM 15787 / PB90-1) TaxID=452637 RepID=B1ZMK7_OPITP|nr:PLP-dependent aminotransferase family protein [Opitutus terrae]ACB74352.1 transcriptional regulator, GntR family with aminotransferase domain [Opitutus terrae PB90-1]
MIWLEFQRSGGGTLTKQLYDQLVTRILSGELAAGTRLPSSRELAAENRIARNIVVHVYEQLLAEGYVESREGSGTFVAKLNLPALPTRKAQPSLRRAASRDEVTPPRPSRHSPTPADLIAFASGVPDLARFPRALWLRCLQRASFYGDFADWGYTEPAGNPALRMEIAAHLRRAKDLDCTPEQVIVTAGTAHAIQLLCAALREFRTGALVEDPVVSFVPEILRRAGHAITPVPVDAHGLVVDALPARPKAGFVFVSPSHQFPLGGTLPIQRRLALLDYARRHDLFLVEDDYDSEFRFGGAPVSSLFRLDPRRAIHVGTFSKVLAPALRLGYLVLPVELLPAMHRTLEPMNPGTARIAQATLARFMHDGHLVRHVARMKKSYQRKMRALQRALEDAFADRVVVSGNTTGLHLAATFTGVKFDHAWRERMQASGVDCDTANDYAFAGARHSSMLVLGYGNLTVEQIAEGVRRLRGVIPA